MLNGTDYLNPATDFPSRLSLADQYRPNKDNFVAWEPKPDALLSVSRYVSLA